MLKEQAKLFTRLTIVVDLALVVIAFYLAYLIRRLFLPALFPFREYAWLLLAVLPLWGVLLSRNRLFASIRRLTFFEIATRLISAHLGGAVILAALIFFIDRHLFSRSFFLLFLALSLLLLFFEKAALRLTLGYLRRYGFNFRQILIVGTREKARRFQQLVNEHADWGLRVVGFVQAIEAKMPQEIYGHPVLGHVRDLVEICKQNTVDEVVFCLPKNLFIDAEAYVRDLEELGITVRMVLDFYELEGSRKELGFFHDEIPMLTFHSKSFNAQQLLAKRVLDIFGSVVGLLVTGALLPLVALAIRLDSPGPIFFSQNRVGEAGRTFRCWKFRTMHIDAEACQGELFGQNEMHGPMFKMRNDPRVTRVGRFLRRTSLDELPQFWNVLRGEMSLVGTRPPTPDEVRRYENWHRRRISIRPGITGMWQVNGRSEISRFDEIVRLDLEYIDQWSLWLDLKILVKTFRTVLSRRGSC